MIDLDQGGATYGHREWVRPPADLVPMIEYAWIERRDSNAPSIERPWRIVPDMSPHLIYSRAESSRLRVVGARSRWTDIDVSVREVTVGLRFRPGAAARGLRINADELTDGGHSFEALRPGEHLRERLDDAPSDRARVALLLEAVRDWSWSIPRDWRSSAVLALAYSGHTRVAEMARQTRVSSRTLHDVMRREIGMSPKRAARIIRLTGAIRAGAAAPGRSWRDVAAAAGFADQAHLIRDCRELLGETPGHFLARAD